MSIIKILPEKLVNQIAAGEVIERPASVIKELVENSLDAGADRIMVDVKDSGKSFIKVSDNGCGMTREDLELALMRHATSKISDEADLWQIQTMGFRGEAMASIASVSKMTIKSKKASDLSGAQIDSVGGDIKSISEVGMSDGTAVEVYELFFNTPARQKYLKQESTELGHISSLLNTIALAHSELAIKLIHNGKAVFDYAKSTDLINRVADVFGKNSAEAMIPIFFGGSALSIDGYIGKPLLSRSTGAHQYVFVNGRPIQHHLLANRIKAAYHSMLMEHKKPVFILNIKIDPRLIDVNVHPRKIEIRFEDQETLIRAVYGCVKVALEKADLMPKGFSESRRYMSDGLGDSVPKSIGAGDAGFAQTADNLWKGGGNFLKTGQPRVTELQGAMDFSKQILQERDARNLEELEQKPVIRAISQVANSYIVAENDEGLVLIDQHAAHERVRFEELMDQFEKQEKSIQPLLVPQQVEFSAEEMEMVKEHAEIFLGLGFEVEPFGGNTFVIQAVPSCLSGEDIDQVVKGVLDDIIEDKAPSAMQGKVEEILTYMSCRSAIKFGQKLSLDEMQGLILQMEKLKRPYTCPHGRPTMVKLTLDELGKMFGRK